MRKESYFSLLPLVSGVLLGIAFNVPYAWPLVFIALVPMLFFIVQSKWSARSVFVGGFGLGVVFFGSVFFWIFDSHPLGWAGVTDLRISAEAVLMLWIAHITMPAVFIGLWALAYRMLRQGALSDIVLGAALWILFEWLRTFGFSLIAYGDGTFFGAHWTFGNLGYALADSPLLFLAPFGGMYLLSFGAVLVNVAVFMWMQKNQRVSWRIYGIVSAVIILILFSGMVFSSPARQVSPSYSEDIGVALLYTDFPAYFSLSSEENHSQRAAFFSLLLQISAKKEKPDLVVFPEDTRFLQSFSLRDRAALLQGVSGGQSMIFIDSARTEIDGRIFSLLSYYDEGGRVIGEQRKSLLVPHGEYLPFVTGTLARLFGASTWADAFRKNREYTHGESPVVVHTRQGNFGALFCSEILSSVLYDALAEDGADVLINTASLSFAHNSALLDRHTRAEAQMRAAETGRFFLRAANGAGALVITSDGVIRSVSGTGTGILYARIPRIAEQTYFTRIGNWPVFLSIIIVSYAFLKKRDISIRFLAGFLTYFR